MKEKEHWKTSIDRKVQRAIDADVCFAVFPLARRGVIDDFDVGRKRLHGDDRRLAFARGGLHCERDGVVVYSERADRCPVVKLQVIPFPARAQPVGCAPVMLAV